MTTTSAGRMPAGGATEEPTGGEGEGTSGGEGDGTSEKGTTTTSAVQRLSGRTTKELTGMEGEGTSEHTGSEPTEPTSSIKAPTTTTAPTCPTTERPSTGPTPSGGSPARTKTTSTEPTPSGGANDNLTGMEGKGTSKPKGGEPTAPGIMTLSEGTVPSQDMSDNGNTDETRNNNNISGTDDIRMRIQVARKHLLAVILL